MMTASASSREEMNGEMSYPFPSSPLHNSDDLAILRVKLEYSILLFAASECT